MLTLFRWLLRLLLGFAILAAVAGAAAVHLVMRSLPEYAATHEVAGISADVEIVRDSRAIPHIFGRSDSDAFFGLGFAHAQDRLWQMEILRRTAQGRLSELFGERTYDTDLLLRRLGLYRFAAASVEAQDDSARSALEAYADGVNAWIRIVGRDALGRGAPEFLIFRNEIERWRPADSLAILNLQALLLTEHLYDEVLRAKIANRLSPEIVPEILPDPPGGLDTGYSYGTVLRSEPDTALPSLDQAGAGFLMDYFRGRGGASNAWAADGQRTVNGRPILANDPHLPFSAPSIWMLARISLATGDVIGGTIPGVPVFPVGRSSNIAWGLTYAFLDNQDLYFEKLEGDDRYLVPGGSEEFQVFREQIFVRGQEPRTIELMWTENGPVIGPMHFGTEDIVPEGHVATLAWSMLHPANTSMTAAYRLMTSADVDEALEAGRHYRSPPMNMFVADSSEIAMQMIGAMPRRHAFHETLGRLPAAGWKSVNRWQGEFPYEAMPRIRNPADGMLANTNNKSVDLPFPGHVSFTWGDAQRIERLKSLFTDRAVHSLESFKETQLDTTSYAATSLVALMGRDLWHTVGQESQDEAAQLRTEAIRRLGQWTGDMNEHLPEPLIYSAWVRSLHRLLLEDDLGPLFEELGNPDPVFIERVLRDVDGSSAWCDIKQSVPIETCSDLASTSLDYALSGLNSEYGSDIDAWRWGDAHVAEHKHQVLGDYGIFRLLNIYQPTSGGNHTINRGVTSGNAVGNPYSNVHGPGYRGVYDLSTPDASAFVISTGQSGHLLSPHYDDLATLWRKGEYVTMSLDPIHARAASVGTTHLVAIGAR